MKSILTAIFSNYYPYWIIIRTWRAFTQKKKKASFSLVRYWPCRPTSPPPSYPHPRGIRGMERTSMISQEPVYTVDVKRQRYWYLLWKNTEPVCLVRETFLLLQITTCSGRVLLKQNEKVGRRVVSQHPFTYPSILPGPEQLEELGFGWERRHWWGVLGAESVGSTRADEGRIAS